jgi:hypothetical protein
MAECWTMFNQVCYWCNMSEGGTIMYLVVTHHACHNGEVDQIRASQPQGAGDHTQAGLEVHEAQHTCDQQQDVDAVQGKVPCKQKRRQNNMVAVFKACECIALDLELHYYG